MGKKCLIIYSSYSGNTEKVARRIESTFQKTGWDCDVFKIRKNADDILRPSFNIYDYNFVCVGSGLRVHLPYNEILNVLRLFNMISHHRKIVLGPDSRKAIIFVTYGGYEFGPKEAEPALSLLDLEIEHIGFKCIGHFCCPGRFINDPMPQTYHGDIRHGPDEQDLLKAEMFIEEKLEEIADRSG